MAGLLRVALRADIAQIQRVRHAVRENRLTSSVVTDDDVRRHLEEQGRGWVVVLDGTPGTRAEAFYRPAGWRDAGPAAHGEIRFEMEAQPA